MINIIDEIWRDMAQFNGEFEISNLGRIRRKSKNKIMKINSKGGVVLSYCGTHHSISVTQTVAEYFLALPAGYSDVTKLTAVRINDDKSDLCVTNLKWVPKIAEYTHIDIGESKTERYEKAKEKQKKTAVVQLRMNGEYIRRYFDISEVLSVHPTWESGDILMCITGHFPDAYGYRFMYESDYLKK